MDNQPPDSPRRTSPWVVFDGDCAFCTSSASWVSARLRREGRPPAELVPWQFTDLTALGTTRQRAQREVLWVPPEGPIRGGADAFAAWLRFSGSPYVLLGRVMTWPGVRQLARAVYRLVAANRQHLPGGSPACALPPAGFDPAEPGSKSL